MPSPISKTRLPGAAAIVGVGILISLFFFGYNVQEDKNFEKKYSEFKHIQTLQSPRVRILSDGDAYHTLLHYSDRGEEISLFSLWENNNNRRQCQICKPPNKDVYNGKFTESNKAFRGWFFYIPVILTAFFSMSVMFLYADGIASTQEVVQAGFMTWIFAPLFWIIVSPAAIVLFALVKSMFLLL